MLRQGLPALATVPATALLTVITCVSYSAIIFSGPMAGYYAVGVGLAFVSAIVLTLVVCLSSSYPGSLGYAQAEPAVIIAVIVHGLATSLLDAAAPEQVLPTVLVAISLASLLCGLGFALLGWLHCGDLVRFVPLPVVGGFLAGVGFLLVKASLTATLGPTLAAGLPGSLLRGDALAHWLPGVGCGLALWLLQARRSSFLNLPAVLGVVMTLFWLTAALAGATPGDLARSGWLYADLPAHSLWSAGQQVARLDLVAWRLLPGHALEFLTLLVVTTIAMLLTANSIELSVGHDIDLNRELRWLGLGNLMVGLLGALPGYHSTSGSILTHRLGTPWRVVGALTALACTAVLLIGPGILPLLPKMVAGTILFYVGLGLMIDWLYRSWSRMHPADYLVLVLVFVFVGFVGLIEGLGIGIAAGLVIFVLRYSRIDAVRNTGSGVTLRSNLERTEAARGALQRLGAGIFILTLQGYVFFGTSHKLLSLIRRRMLDPEAAPLGFLVLDFQLVSGLDFVGGGELRQARPLFDRARLCGPAGERARAGARDVRARGAARGRRGGADPARSRSRAGMEREPAARTGSAGLAGCRRADRAHAGGAVRRPRRPGAVPASPRGLRVRGRRHPDRAGRRFGRPAVPGARSGRGPARARRRARSAPARDGARHDRRRDRVLPRSAALGFGRRDPAGAGLAPHAHGPRADRA